jgi:hypothetical protein
MTKAIFIDSEKRELREIDLPQREAMSDAIRKLLGGWLTTAWTWPNDDVLFVDDDALLKPTRYFFRISTRSDGQPLGGHGVVVGHEIIDRGNGDWLGNADVGISIVDLRPLIDFLTREQAEAWFQGNASEPMITISSVSPDGKIQTEVITRAGTMIREMPKPDDDPEAA